MRRIIYKVITYIIFLSPLVSCQEEWLEIKRDKQQVVPSSLDDLQALLSYSGVMNFNATPSLGEIATDDYYLLTEDWQSLRTPELRNNYIWAEDIYEGQICYSWNRPYQQVFYSNLVLEGLEKIDVTTTDFERYENIKGSALFYRSFAFYHLLQIFCKQYDPETAAEDPGIPLRLETDVNLISTRSSVEEGYNRVIQDLNEAEILLPDNPSIKTQPSKAAANALLAKVYLQMGNYEASKEYAEACLDIQSILMDYNTIDTETSNPFLMFNEEVIFHSTMLSPAYYIMLAMHVNEELYSLYTAGDLRKDAYFSVDADRIQFKGSYNGNPIPFSGLATDEVYLILSECYAREGKTADAMTMLNELLKKRWVAGEFEPMTATNPKDALDIILEERRKSLCFRGIRWMDLRRLNQLEGYNISLAREIGGNSYVLEPNDPKYVFAIPDEVIEMSGIEQNER